MIQDDMKNRTSKQDYIDHLVFIRINLRFIDTKKFVSELNLFLLMIIII